ncbi:MAG: class I SAM-dependent methyltransferase [Pyrinomonadaceae bacterium]
MQRRTACPACHFFDSISAGTKNGFDILVCRKCRSIYTGHLPLLHEAENYDEYYNEANLTVPAFVLERVREIINGFSDFRQSNRLLDIGFGAGTILEIASEIGWQPFGLEVSKPAIEQARTKGFQVFHGSLSEAAYPDSYFDVVTASEILEHLPDPEKDLREIARILRPGGLLWATTPSACSASFRVLGLDWSILCPPEHIQLYSKTGASLMLKKAGFSKTMFKTYGLNPAEIVNHFGRRSCNGKVFDRVGTGYALNETMTKGPFRKRIKGILNLGLDITGLGDSLKIFAQK